MTRWRNRRESAEAWPGKPQSPSAAASVDEGLSSPPVSAEGSGRSRPPAPVGGQQPAPVGASTGSPRPVNTPQAGLTADEVLADLATIDAGDSEAVLHRAIELAESGMLVADQFPQASLEEVAAELQIPLTAVADALAEYRAGALPLLGEDGPRRRSVLDRMVGPAVVTVRHHTGLAEEATMARLGDWFKRRHRLRTRINARGAVVGVRRRGMVTLAARQVRSATGRAGLSGLREVRGAAVAVDDGHTAFCVVADVSDHRTRSVVAGSAVAIGGTAVVSTVALVTAPVTFIGVPVFVGAGWVTSRLSHRHRVRRVTEEVEMTADEIAAGADPRNLAQELGTRLSDSIASRSHTTEKPKSKSKPKPKPKSSKGRR